MTIGKTKTLVLGGNGFIARGFMDYSADSLDIFAVSRSPVNGFPHTVIESYDGLPEAVFKDRAVVVNCVGMPNPEAGDSVLNRHLNATLPSRFAEQAKAAGVGIFVHLSTIAVYGDVNRIDRHTPVNASMEYGRDKLDADLALQALADSSFKVSVLRAPIVFGPGDKRLISRLIRFILRFRAFPYHPDRGNRSIIYLDNLARAVEAAARRGQSGTFLVSDPGKFTIALLSGIVQRVTGRKVYLIRPPEVAIPVVRKMAPHLYRRLFTDSIVDAAWDLEQLGVGDVVGLEAALERTVQWVIEHG